MTNKHDVSEFESVDISRIKVETMLGFPSFRIHP